MRNKKIAKQIFFDALSASLPKKFIHNFCTLKGNILSLREDEYNLKNYKNIYVFGSGKASLAMATEIEHLLKEKIFDGVIISPQEAKNLRKIKVLQASHPLPTQKSIDATKELLEVMHQCKEDDFYIYLLSGGTSALLELPQESISLKELQETTSLMLESGLNIQEINSVRKELSQVKGGQLAKHIKATGVVLVLSDVIDDDLHSIGSAPLYFDNTNSLNVKEVLNKHKLLTKVPLSVQIILNKTKIHNDALEKKAIKHYIIASNKHALHAAFQSAKKEFPSVKIIKEPMVGDVKEFTQNALKIIKNSDTKCIIFGGECTVKLTKSGQGGRNQHAVALMLKELCHSTKEFCFLSASTDGIDGNSDAAGAVIDKQSCKILKESNIDIQNYIDNFDSYHLLKLSDDLIITGYTNTNVIDLAIIIKGD